MPKLILTLFKSEKVAQFGLGGRAAQIDFDTFYSKGENKSEKFPKLRAIKQLHLFPTDLLNVWIVVQVEKRGKYFWVVILTDSGTSYNMFEVMLLM